MTLSREAGDVDHPAVALAIQDAKNIAVALPMILEQPSVRLPQILSSYSLPINLEDYIRTEGKTPLPAVLTADEQRTIARFDAFLLPVREQYAQLQKQTAEEFSSREATLAAVAAFLCRADIQHITQHLRCAISEFLAFNPEESHS